ncbi:MAG TPA: glycosyltransferase family 4 protein [Candidatus Polarisedimenticolia bacterium]|jgi:glycosyltransferase involved in cell wall biosynthesis|nr:glycosyltransferase family 4 protein [Candidatus Polarisedimenticolia bacterium]
MTERGVRVCHVITRLELGGAQDNTLYTVSHLGAPFVPSLLCGPGGILDEEASRLGVPVRFVPSLQRPIRPHRDLAALVHLHRLFREMRPDIVHTHSSKAGVVGRLAARLAGVPHVVHTIHGFGFHAGQPWPIRRALVGAERLAARATSHFIAVSRANLETGIALGLFARDRVTLIRSGVHLEAFEEATRGGARREARDALRRQLGVAPDAPLIGMIACLKPQKSPRTFVEVAARVVRQAPRAVFVLAGDGELRRELERRIRDLNLSAGVRLLGWRRDVPRLMAGLDVLLHTSLWEGLPRVLPEAIAASVPIVATGVDGTRDILRDGETGIVCAPLDAEGMASGVLRLLDDRHLASALARRARAVLPEFDMDGMVRAQERLYLEITRNRRNVSGGRSSITNNDAPIARPGGGNLAAAS